MANSFKQNHPFSWLIFAAIISLQTVNGTRFVYSSYSLLMMKRYGISHVKFNNLIAASDTGRLFGWFSSTAAKHFPAWFILLTGLVLGLVGYGAQYSCVVGYISLSYWHGLVLNFLAGIGICWINTYCELVACKHFKRERKTVVNVTSSYSWLTGKVYSYIVQAIGLENDSRSLGIYLLLSCVVPCVVGLVIALSSSLLEVTRHEGKCRVQVAFAIAITTAIYSILEKTTPSLTRMSPIVRLASFMFVLMLPIAVALSIAAREIGLAKWRGPQVIPESNSDNNVVEQLDIVVVQNNSQSSSNKVVVRELGVTVLDEKKDEGDINESVELRDERRLKDVLTKVEFWLYYFVYMCGPTVGMVYLNNLKRIVESCPNFDGSVILALASTYGFLGRIVMVIFVWYTRGKTIISEPALTSILMIPMPIAFFILINNNTNKACLYSSTIILGTCSGAISVLASPILKKLFGTKNLVITDTVLFTNIPLGSFLFGYIAAHNYETQSEGDQVLCMGPKCHHTTFIVWGSASAVGTILSFVMHFRTRRLFRT